jgi:hypothetical protein
MDSHQQKIERIARELKRRDRSRPVSLKKRVVAHQVPKARDRRRNDQKIDISELDGDRLEALIY